MPTTEEPTEIVIRSEDDAWEMIKAAHAGGNFAEDVKIRFIGWPTFEVGYKGRDWRGTVPTRVMPPLLEMQRVINRAYAQVQYDEANLQRLRDDERDRLELVVRVRNGSSVFDAELWTQLSRIGEAAVQRMNGTEAVITVLGVALLIAAPVMYKAWIDKRKHEKEIESRIEVSRQETERWRLMNETLRDNARLQVVNDDMLEASTRLLKATRGGDVVDRHDVVVPAEEAHVLATRDPQRSHGAQYSGRFVIEINRTNKSAGFRITARHATDGFVITAEVPPDLAWDQQEAIRNAEWSKSPVELTIDAELLGDRVTSAIVISAAAVL